MKRNFFSILILSGAVFVYSCNNDGQTSGNNDTANTNNTNDATSNTTNNTDASTTGTANAAPLNQTDQQFVMEAAKSDMMEIESANIAQQNAQSERVKAYAAMMLRDHGASSSEMKTFVASRNVMLPDSLSAAERQHIEAMRKMKGKAFDNHYMKMMTDDHSKVVNRFQVASNNATDADLKAWATKQLPVLRAHLDSAKAIRAKM
jgi:putative membrane protein